MKKNFTTLLCAALLLFLATPSQSQLVTFKAFLSGSQQTKRVISTGSGEITAVLIDTTLTVSGNFKKLMGNYDPNIGSHLHAGLPGQNGPVEIALNPIIDVGLRSGSYSEAMNTFALTQDQVNTLLSYGFYVNIHTSSFSSGELRGQLLPAADKYYGANLLASNATGTVLSRAEGAIQMIRNGDILVVAGSFSGLSSPLNVNILGGIHLHMAIPGKSGGVIFPLVATSDTSLLSATIEADKNSFNLTDDQIKALDAGMIYCNVHSTKYASGEIRGQILEQAGDVYRCFLSGSNQNPINSSTGTGVVMVAIKLDSLMVWGSYDNLSSEVATEIGGGAHIHGGLPGQNGGVQFALTSTFDSDGKGGVFEKKNNTFGLNSEQAAMIMERRMYINVHTNAFNSGEIRGQILHESNAVFQGYLSGSQAKPYVSSSAKGAVAVELSGDQLALVGTFGGLNSQVNVNIAGGAHIHNAPAGRSGPIAFPLVTSLSNDSLGGQYQVAFNTFSIDAAQVEELFARKFYVNIHTFDNTSGAVRAQILPQAGRYYFAPLSGSSERTPVMTDARGMIIIESNGDKAILSGSFENLSSPLDTSIAGGVHIHAGKAGQNGGIRHLLTSRAAADLQSVVFEAEDNQLTLDSAGIRALIGRGYYVNVHSQSFGSGEIRGSILPMATSYFGTTLAGLHAVPPTQSSGFGGLKAEIIGNELIVSGSFANLGSAVNTTIAGGAHLHSGNPSNRGGISVVLSPTLSSDSLSGTFESNNNRFPLTSDQIKLLYDENLYLNIHSLNFRGGELRGQLVSEFNSFPVQSKVNQPLNDDKVILEGSRSNPAQFAWTSVIDGPENAYIWQLSDNPDFSDLLINRNVGTDTSVEMTFAALDLLLANAGIEVGVEDTLYQRVIVTDGSLDRISETFSVRFERGKLIDTEFLARISGHQQVPTVITHAYGEITADLDSNKLIVCGYINNLSDRLAVDIAGGIHIHMGYAGQGGPVIFPLITEISNDSLSATISFDSNTFELDTAQMTALQNRQLYINVHSLAYPGGEVRGQLLPTLNNSIHTATMQSSQVRNSVLSMGSGALALEIFGNQLKVTGSFRNLEGDYNVSHLHLGYAGQNGGVELPLSATVIGDARAGLYEMENNTFTISGEQADFIRQRRIYANVHSTAQPSGEIRGQVIGDARAVFNSFLSGSNHTPTITSFGGGRVIIEQLNDTSLVVSGSYQGLESDLAVAVAGGAHLHRGIPGTNGGIIFPLTIANDETTTAGVFLPADNRQTVDSSTIAQLHNRATYVNIHSIDHPSGELRGPMLAESQVYLKANLSGIFTVPQVTTRGSGDVHIELNGNRMAVVGSLKNLSSPVNSNIAGGIHIHEALPGQTGGINFRLANFTFDSVTWRIPVALNQFILAPTDFPRLLERESYINVHSLDNSSGELRGQIVPQANAYFVAALSGASQTPPVKVGGTGMMIAEVRNNSMTVTGAFQNLESDLNTDIAGGVHIHTGLAGQGGPVLRLLKNVFDGPVTEGVYRDDDNQFNLSSGMLDTLRNRMMYVNVHSLSNPAGELRGQFLPLSNAHLTANLAGRNAVQPVRTTGRGAIKAELNGNQLVLSGAFSDLQGDFNANIGGGSHVHNGGTGSTGSVAVAIAAQVSGDLKSGIYNAGENQYTLTEEQIDALLSGETYINIHTTEVGSGEIRGQLLNELNFHPSDEAAITSPEDGTSIVLEGDPGVVFTAGWSRATDRDSLSYIWEVSGQSNFSTILFARNVGQNLSYMNTAKALDSILAVLGVMDGGSIALYHRPVACDGSLCNEGQGSLVTFTRGIFTGTRDLSPLGFNAFVMPSLLSNQDAVLTVRADEAFTGQVVLTDLLGRKLSSDRLEVAFGEETKQLQTRSLEPGMYLVNVVMSNKLIYQQKIIIQ